MNCGFKGWRFKSFFLPMNLFNIFYVFNYVFYNLNLVKLEYSDKFLIWVNTLYNYYNLNELIWQEGLLIDFLQKKLLDNWIKKFLIYSSYLFNERLVFDKIIKFYLNLVLLPFHKISILEFGSISSVLFTTIFFFIIIFLIFFYIYCLILMF